MESNCKINCEDCAEHNPAPVSYLVHESITVKQERTIRRLWILCLVLIICLVGTNLAWAVYETQFEDVSVSQAVDTGSGDAVVSGVGDLNYYGESNPNG